MNLNFQQIMRYQDVFIEGAIFTLALTVLATLIGTVMAIAGAVAHKGGPKLVRYAIRAYIEFIRNTPFLIQIFIVFFVLPYAGIRLQPFYAATLALSIYFCAYTIEVIRSGLESIPKSQIEAGFCLGLTRWQVFRHVILVSMLRVVYPSYTSQFILLLMGSSIASQISAEELFHIAGFVESRTYRSFEVYSLVCAIYLFMSISFKLFFAAAGRVLFRWPT